MHHSLFGAICKKLSFHVRNNLVLALVQAWQYYLILRYVSHLVIVGLSQVSKC